MVENRGRGGGSKETSLSLSVGQHDQRTVTEGLVSGNGGKAAGMGREGSGKLPGTGGTHVLSAVGEIAVWVEEVSSETDSWLPLPARNAPPCLPVGTLTSGSESIFLDCLDKQDGHDTIGVH